MKYEELALQTNFPLLTSFRHIYFDQLFAIHPPYREARKQLIDNAQNSNNGNTGFPTLHFLRAYKLCIVHGIHIYVFVVADFHDSQNLG